jgi:hypothetical protein
MSSKLNLVLNDVLVALDLSLLQTPNFIKTQSQSDCSVWTGGSTVACKSREFV